MLSLLWANQSLWTSGTAWPWRCEALIQLEILLKLEEEPEKEGLIA